MANYNDNASSFINGLSDFWLRYFQEIDQIETLYKGTEVLVGQGYLDLMALLLNNSVQDTTLFNKEYFKLLRIKESDIKFKQVTTAATGRYNYVLPDNVRFVRNLNNKIFNPTLSLDNDVEFYIDESNYSLNFQYDPMNAHYERDFGSADSSFTIRSVITHPDDANIRVWLNDNGTPLSVVSSGYDITINYDGPSNTSTTTALQIVQAVNTTTNVNQLITAALSGTGTGSRSPSGTISFVPLLEVSYNPLFGAVTRNIETLFGGKFTVPTQSNWVNTGTKKGDILRLLGSPTVGAPEDLEINLVREEALYVNANGIAVTQTGAKQDFAVLRKPDSNVSENEPLVAAGLPVQSGADGSIDATTYEFSSPSASFYGVHVGDLIELIGTSNTGYFRIIEVLNINTVVLGVTNAVTESPLNWTHVSTIQPLNINTDGQLVDNGNGTATFTAASAAFTSTYAGTVLRVYRGGEVESYYVINYTSPTSITLKATAAVPGVGLTWGWATIKPPLNTVAFSPPIAYPASSEISVAAKRLVDGRVVEPGVDYTFSATTGIITPLTVWQPSVTNKATYTYLLCVVNNTTPLSSGINGTITPGTPAVFTSPTASFTQSHVGYAIKISNSGLLGATNNGVHFIATVTSPTTVTLTTDKVVPSTVDPNNGSLTWELYARGNFTNRVTAQQYESAYWCPDVLVDRFHLYITYGYLINRFERSSEEYRAFIRGLFQLLMLGPTLERFESAINTVAGFSVIRDTGEILLSYDNGDEFTATDGVFTGATSQFSSASATFTVADTTKYIYAVDGFNKNKLFKIVNVINPNTVLLDSIPVTDSSVQWELTSQYQQKVRTSRTTYTFDRRVPLKTDVTDPANVGVKIFRAFEVITDIFRVTDYLEDSNWWELVQIPTALMPDQTSLRRQSSPTLYENVVSPSDDGRVGDPGFYIGASSEGIVPAVSLVRAGIADGVLTPDPLYPFSNNVYFDSATGNFTNSDVGNLLQITALSQSFLIEQRISSTRVKIQAFLPVTGAAGLTWNILTGTLPKRHKAAFVILDRLLKYHTFQVTFDSTLLDLGSGSLLTDLQELVFVAKPTYTYLALTPAALFQEIIKINEELNTETTIFPGGSSGMTVVANQNPLVVIGASWRVGNWFRYVSNVSTFAAPTLAVPNALGVPTVGFTQFLSKAFVDPAAFTSASAPIQVSDLTGTTNTSTVCAVAPVDSEITAVTATSAVFLDSDVMQYITLSGSGLGNDGSYRITSVISNTVVYVYAPGLVSETGLTGDLVSKGSNTGYLVATAQGEALFEDLSTRSNFTVANVANYVRLPYLNYLPNPALRINEILTPSKVLLAEEHRVHPVVSEPDVAVTVSGNFLTVLTPSDLIFSQSMCRSDREVQDYSTSLKDKFYVEFSTGPDAGSRFYLDKYYDASTVTLLGSPTATASALCHVGVVRAPEVVEEIASWELVQDQITIDADNILFLNTVLQDANPAVSYTAYGVREPIDPTAVVFDATLGDTYYSIGMPDPRQHRGRSRTGRDTDLREEPVQITRTP